MHGNTGIRKSNKRSSLLGNEDQGGEGRNRGRRQTSRVLPVRSGTGGSGASGKKVVKQGRGGDPIAKRGG